MATLGALCNKIADDLARPNLLPQVRDAVQAAISFYESEPFAWSQRTLVVPGAAGDDALPLPSGVRQVRTARLVQPQLWALRAADAAWIEARQDGSIQGDPTHYTWAGQDALRLYPIPHRAFTLRLLADCDQPPLTEDGDSNLWTTEGFDLIRQHTAADVLANVIRGAAGREEAMARFQQAALHLSRLKLKLARRTTGRLRGDMA